MVLTAVSTTTAGALVAAKPTGPPKPSMIKGRVLFRTGPTRTARPDAQAKVWLFRTREELALRSAEKLQQFEKEFPQGLTRVEDRPIEDQTRMSAMVLMTYATLHKDTLRGALPVSGDGSFQFTWDGREPLTLVVESAATMGSYHMPRYAVKTLEPGHATGAVPIDFGVSHLESHPAAPGAAGEAVGK